MILTTKQVAERYHLSETCVRIYANKGLLPYGYKIGASRRWNSEDLDAFDAQKAKEFSNREAV
ncbi:MAG: helix-turn-helix domain-containing protein [Synergistaceae bacterium]|nr:helix-turn-helix domain-containing protein [Synergistaceae bacterium]MBQ6434785.1 helix-turn-helix domain-containing protein [Synergistaceae bacterium]MBQ6737782.1 helix-turn-helix domain-containing protein [Synergistaceae bacterium]MBR0076247.1 helix-turn-helix domain-containing protein [Synergistaceae bacterium]MBR0232810.1 helix-turn-helix domain-containing protein [Synergistaceae bacterium]